MDKKLGTLLFVFFILFTIFASAIIFNKSLVSFTRAKEDFAPSAKSSLLFAFPLLLKADGVAKTTINVFIRSDKGMPVKNQSVMVSASLGQLSSPEITTDDKGKGIVTLTSTTPGTSVISATIGGAIKMTQTLTITFE